MWPLVEDDDPVGERERLALVVGDVDEGRARLTVHATELGLHLEPDPQVERRERLVEKQHARAVDERPSERDALQLPARELVCPTPLEPVEADEREHLVDPSLHVCSLSIPATRSPKATFSKTSRCGKSVARWKTMFTGRRCGGTRVTSRPCRTSRPSVGSDEAGDDAQERRLPAAGRAEQRDELAVARS